MPSCRKQIQKLAEVRKSSSAHSEHKKRQIIEMVRDDTEVKLEEMVRVDAQIQRMFFPRGLVRRAEVFTGPLSKVSFRSEIVPHWLLLLMCFSPPKEQDSGSEVAKKTPAVAVTKELARQMSDSMSAPPGKSKLVMDDGLRCGIAGS